MLKECARTKATSYEPPPKATTKVPFLEGKTCSPENGENMASKMILLVYNYVKMYIYIYDIPTCSVGMIYICTHSIHV